LMSIYAQNAKIPLQSEIDRLYERNNVSSRRDLTRAQLDEEISRYRFKCYLYRNRESSIHSL